jgi:hypothetical protein
MATAVSQTEIDLVAIYSGPPFPRAFSFEYSDNSGSTWIAFSDQIRNTFADQTLSAGQTRSYRARVKLDSGRTTGYSSLQSATTYPPTQTVTPGSSLWLPGIIGRTGAGNYSGFGNQIDSTVIPFIKKAIAADINNKIVGFCVPAVWKNLQGDSPGLYDGSWGSNTGFPAVQKFISLLKSYPFKRFLMLSLNQTGNGAGANTNSAFPSSFAPAYLNSSTYGGGCEWGGRPGYSGYPNVNSTFWNVNTAIEVAKMVKAYNTHFGPFNPATGDGIGMWELTNEMSLQTTSALNNPEFVNAIINGYGTIRTGADAAPEVLLSMRPTYVHPETPTGYTAIMNAMLGARILMGNEDGSNNFLGQNAKRSWCDNAYAGCNPGTGVRDLTMTDYTANNSWGFVFNVENAELGKERSPTAAVPNADVGSGYWYDVPTFSGIMGGANRMNASYIIIFLDPQIGPNVNGFQFPRTDGTQPANPTPGPGAGLKSARPHSVDVITGNASADPTGGITGPLVVPRITRPTGW